MSARSGGAIAGTAAIASVLALACSLALGGCASASSASQSITGSWQLSSGRDSGGILHLGGATVTLKVAGAKSEGQGPCNAYGADVTSSTTGALTITRGISTTMACAIGARNILEGRYFDDLNDVRTASIRDGSLVLSGHDLTLTFRALTTSN